MASGEQTRSRTSRPVRPPARVHPPAGGARGRMILHVVGLLLVATGLVVPIGSLDAETAFGPVAVKLHATAYAHSVSYEGQAGLGSAGGLLGSLAAGANFGGNISIKDTKVYLTGLGDFQETIGFLKGSGKNRTHSLSPFIYTSDGEATIKVRTEADLIPWWPVGLPQKVRVVVALAALHNVTKVTVTKVWVEVWRETPDKKVEVATVWTLKDPATSFTSIGQSATFPTDVTIPDDIGNFGLVGRAEIRIENAAGSVNQPNHVTKSFTDEAGPPKILLWTVGASTVTRLGLLIGGFPIMVGGFVAAAIGVARPAHRYSRRMVMAGGILAVVGVISLAVGIDALMALTGFGQYFTWNPLIGLPMAGGILLVVSNLSAGAEASPGRPGATKEPRQSKSPAQSTIAAGDEVVDFGESEAPRTRGLVPHVKARARPPPSNVTAERQVPRKKTRP